MAHVGGEQNVADYIIPVSEGKSVCQRLFMRAVVVIASPVAFSAAPCATFHHATICCMTVHSVA